MKEIKLFTFVMVAAFFLFVPALAGAQEETTTTVVGAPAQAGAPTGGGTVEVKADAKAKAVAKSVVIIEDRRPRAPRASRRPCPIYRRSKRRVKTVCISPKRLGEIVGQGKFAADRADLAIAQNDVQGKTLRKQGDILTRQDGEIGGLNSGLTDAEKKLAELAAQLLLQGQTLAQVQQTLAKIQAAQAAHASDCSQSGNPDGRSKPDKDGAEDKDPPTKDDPDEGDEDGDKDKETEKKPRVPDPSDKKDAPGGGAGSMLPRSADTGLGPYGLPAVLFAVVAYAGYNRWRRRNA